MATVYDLRCFSYDKRTKTLRVNSSLFGGDYPDRIMIHSHHTNRVVTFVVDAEAAQENEFWDGEMCQYVPVGGLPNVEWLIVSPDERSA